MSYDNVANGEITNGYQGVYEFVTEYLSQVYRRQVTDISDTVWCPEWWHHSEAVIRLSALWQAWEHHRLQGGTGISVWFLDHADPHMTKLFDPKGPFKYCSVRNGHKGMLEPLPLKKPEGADAQMFGSPDIDRLWQKGRIPD